MKLKKTRQDNTDTQRQFDNFDEFAEEYREIHNKAIKISGADSNYFSEYKVVEIKKSEQNSRINLLDFGCGDGNSSIYFRKHFEKMTINGIDISEESIRKAKEKNIPDAAFQPFNGLEIPHPDNTFDVVFTSMVFHHIEHRLHANILKEIRRVLVPGGRFYIFEHNPNNPLTRKIVRECIFDQDAVLLKPNYCKNIINQAGFRDANINFTIFFPRHRLLNWATGLEPMLKWLPIGAQYYIKALK